MVCQNRAVSKFVMLTLSVYQVTTDLRLIPFRRALDRMVANACNKQIFTTASKLAVVTLKLATVS